MGRNAVFAAAVLMFCMLCASEAGAQPRTWRYNGTGQWRESEDAPGPARTGNVPNKTLDKAERLTDSGRLEPAHDILLDWLKRTPKAPDRDRAVYLLAQVYYANGDRVWCFYECDELLDNYPDSRLFFPALRLQYQVADAFLNGYKKKFLGLAVVGMREEAIEMLFRIQERSPDHPSRSARCFGRRITTTTPPSSTCPPTHMAPFCGRIRAARKAPRHACGRRIPTSRNFAARATMPRPALMPAPSSRTSSFATRPWPRKKDYRDSLIRSRINWPRRCTSAPTSIDEPTNPPRRSSSIAP